MGKIVNKSYLQINGLCDCDEIMRKLDEIEGKLCDCDAITQEITNIKQEIIEIDRRFEIIDVNLEISDIRKGMTTTPQLSGFGASVISTGPTYSYWGVGIKIGTATLQQGDYYLVTPAQFPELAWYQGDTTISTVWIMSGGVSTAYPLYINQTGIWFHPTNTITLAAGATFNFTQTLILVNPISLP